MTRLALTLPVSPLETPTSYASRLAARNLSPDLATFCQDVGLDFAAISTGDSEAIAHLCTLAGLPENSFRNRTIIKTSTMKYLIGIEVMNTETLSRGEIRYCPDCIAEALCADARPCDVIHELHWQFVHIRRCWRHGAVLQSHRPKIDATSRFDFMSIVRNAQMRQDVVAGEADALDHYLSQRAYGGHGENWSNCLEIPALIKGCEAFGVLVDHGRDMRASSLEPDQRRDAMLTGFKVLSAGENGIRRALDHFNRRTATRGGNQPHPSNGEVQRLLGSHAKLRADLDPLRDIVREYFLDHYPFQSGTTVLGRKVAETRVFSLRGACREIGARRSLVEEMLIRRGLGSHDAEGHFRLEAILTRELIDEIKDEKHDYLDQSQTALFLGCSFAMFKQLQRAGILKPAEGSAHRQRKGFHRAALREFLGGLGAGAERLAKAKPHLCSLDMATRKANCSVPEIVKLILDGRVRIQARLTDDIRLDSLLVDANDITAAFQTEPNGFSLNDAQRHLCINTKTLQLLVARRLLDVQRMRHSVTRVTRGYVTIFYTAYSDLELPDLMQRLGVVAKGAGDLWEAWTAYDDLGPFHLEIMAEYGVQESFKSGCFTRHSKDHTLEAREAMLAFFESLPGRKLLLNGDVFVAFRPE